MRQRLTTIITNYKPQARKALKHNLMPHWLPRAASPSMPGTLQRVPTLGAGPGWAGAGMALPGLQRPSGIKAAVQVDGSDAFLMGWALPPPLLGKGGKSLSGNVNFKGLDRKAYSQTVLSLLDKASCLERLWVGLFKATVDPLLSAPTSLLG